MPFDASSLLNASVDKGMSTDYTNIPVGVYPAVADSIEFRQVSTKDGERFILELHWKISSNSVEQETGRSRNTCKQSLWLDIVNGKLSIAKGHNVDLGRLRETLRQNQPGWKPADLIGKNGRVTVTQELHKGRTFSNVTAVEAL